MNTTRKNKDKTENGGAHSVPSEYTDAPPDREPSPDNQDRISERHEKTNDWVNTAYSAFSKIAVVALWVVLVKVVFSLSGDIGKQDIINLYGSILDSGKIGYISIAISIYYIARVIAQSLGMNHKNNDA